MNWNFNELFCFVHANICSCIVRFAIVTASAIALANRAIYLLVLLPIKMLGAQTIASIQKPIRQKPVTHRNYIVHSNWGVRTYAFPCPFARSICPHTDTLTYCRGWRSTASYSQYHKNMQRGIIGRNIRLLLGIREQKRTFGSSNVRTTKGTTKEAF